MALIPLLKSVLLFISAALLEIAGCYLVWIWLKNDKSFWYGIAGLALLIIYSFVPLLQSTNFGRVNAAYGSIFIVLAVIWGWKIDKVMPDKFDILGSIICLLGVLTIMFPRK